MLFIFLFHHLIFSSLDSFRIECLGLFNGSPHIFSNSIEREMIHQCIFNPNSLCNILQLFLDHALSLSMEEVIYSQLEVFWLLLKIILQYHFLVSILNHREVWISVVVVVFLEQESIVLGNVKVQDSLQVLLIKVFFLEFSKDNLFFLQLSKSKKKHIHVMRYLFDRFSLNISCNSLNIINVSFSKCFDKGLVFFQCPMWEPCAGCLLKLILQVFRDWSVILLQFSDLSR